MKKMVKNLMLVAMAAMAFVGCQQDIEINAELNKASVRVIAGFDDTRSGFGEKVDGAYKQIWNGGEELSYFHYSTSQYFADNGTVTLPEGESTNAVFDIELTGVGNASATAGFIRIASPAASVTANYGGFTVDVPTEQTPLANSVDPLAHILTYQHYYYDGVPETIDARFEHAVAYGKMTLNNLPEGNYDYVTISMDNKTYKLYTTNVENNVFWFGCEAVKPAEVKVSVVDETANVAYTKTLDLAKTTNFQFVNGRLGSFSVEMAGVEATTPEDDSLNISIDKIYDTVVWDSSNSRFKFTGASVNEWRVYLNSADRTNNTMAIGSYTGCGSTSPSQGTFGAEIRSESIFASQIGSASTLSVDYVKGQYVIVMTHNGTTYGYIGMPEGWVAPEDGGGTDEPETPEVVALDTPEVTATASETENSITVSWGAVENAASYSVTFNGTTETVNGTSKTYTGLEWGETYTVEVVAVAAADSTEYKNSEAGTGVATVIADPEAGGGQTDPWEFRLTNVAYASGAYNVTLTGTNGVVMKINGLKLGSSIDVSSVILNDVETAVSGTAAVNYGGVFPVVIDLTITSTGVKYTGSSINGFIDYM